MYLCNLAKALNISLFGAGVKINPTIFRAYDTRGIYPNDLNEEVVYRIARAYGEQYPASQTIVVARDNRLSSPSLAESVIKGLMDSGKEVIDIGIAPDPLFWFAIFHYNFDGGIIITGSHNPKEYNGLMMNIRKPGKDKPEDLISEELEQIKLRIMSDKEFEKTNHQGSLKHLDVKEDYIGYVAKRIKLKKPLKIVVDVGNGACGYLPEEVFKKLGCSVKTLYGEFDGNFPNHLPDPYEEENLKDLKKAVLQEKADVGFCFDTDGDRVAFIDNKGRTVSGDFCLLLLARQVLKNHKGPIVHEMRVSKAFLDEMAKQGVTTYFTVCHHKAVVDKMVETNAVFGGEITLHFFFPRDYYLADDAVFSALKLSEVASAFDDFAAYLDTLPRYSASPEVFIDSPDEKKFGLIGDLVKYLRENNYNFLAIDGARINFPNGWALVRASNTSPMIKCRFEGETEKDLKEIEKEMLAIFEKVGIPVTEKTYQELGL